MGGKKAPVESSQYEIHAVRLAGWRRACACCVRIHKAHTYPDSDSSYTYTHLHTHEIYNNTNKRKTTCTYILHERMSDVPVRA